MVSTSGQRRALLLCMVVGLGARMAIAFFSPLPWHSTDTFEYLSMADAILRGHPSSSFPNGYPLLMVLAKALVPSERVMEAMICLNLAFSTCVIGFAYNLSRSVTRDSTCAFLAGLFVALYPGQVNIARLVLSETAAGFFLAFGIWLLSRGRFVSAGLALGYASLTRTTLAPVIPALAFVLVAFRHPVGEPIRMIGGAISVLLLAQFAEGIGVLRGSNNLGQNVLIATYSASYRIDYGAAFSPVDIAHPFRAYLRFAWSHPVAFVLRRLGSLWQLWGAWPSSGDVHDNLSPISRLVMGLRMPAVIVAGFGFRAVVARWEAWAVGVPVLVLTVVHVALFSYWRFTAPVEPFVLILAAAAVPEKVRAVLERGLQAAKLA